MDRSLTAGALAAMLLTAPAWRTACAAEEGARQPNCCKRNVRHRRHGREHWSSNRPANARGRRTGPAGAGAAEQREAVGKSIEADAKHYVDEAGPLVRDRAIKLAPTNARHVVRGQIHRRRAAAVGRVARVAGQPQIPAGCAPRSRTASRRRWSPTPAGGRPEAAGAGARRSRTALGSRTPEARQERAAKPPAAAPQEDRA